MEDTTISPGPGERPDTRADMDRETAEILTDRLTLASVDTRAQLDPQLPDELVQSLGAANRPGGPIERGEGAVSDVLDDPPAVL